MTNDPLSGPSNLWLAETLWRLGAVQFGDFTLGRTTVHSPIYVNLRLLIAHPTALQRVSKIILQEVQTLQSMRNPQVDEYDIVCGVPFASGLRSGRARWRRSRQSRARCRRRNASGGRSSDGDCGDEPPPDSRAAW